MAGSLISVVQTSPQDWRYVSEGGATMVFSYIGDPLLHPEFAGMVLRLRKISLELCAGENDIYADESDDSMIEFQHSVIERLIPPEHLPRLLSVRVERAWLQDLINQHDENRPSERRRNDSVNLTKKKAVIATDLIGGKGLVVEIKVSAWLFQIIVSTVFKIYSPYPSQSGPSYPHPLTSQPKLFQSR